MEKISVIIPVYKVEEYLHRCVDSVLAQTHTDLEIILVDDGSPDGCGAICDEYAAKDERIKVIHQENRGLSGARNAGWALASGQYIAFLDSDDFIDPEMYEKLLEVLEQTGADIAECGYRWVKPNVTYDRENTGKVDIYTSEEALEMLYFGDQMFGGISIVVWNKLYRAETIKGLQFAEGLNNEDVDFTPRALCRAGRIAKLNLNMHNFFFSPNSISRSSYSLKKLDSLEVRRCVMEFYRQEGMEKYYRFMQSSYFSTLYHHYYECRQRKKEEIYRQAADKLCGEIRQQIPAMLENPYSRDQAWRHRLFLFSPSAWYAVMYAGKKGKVILGNIRRSIKKLRRS